MIEIVLGRVDSSVSQLENLLMNLVLQYQEIKGFIYMYDSSVSDSDIDLHVEGGGSVTCVCSGNFAPTQEEKLCV